jgi:dihydroorotase
MFGSDSAPHPREKKESSNGSAGIFSSPVLLQGLVELFDKNGKLNLLQDFLSENAKEIYGINPPQKRVILKKRDFTVSETYNGVVPLFAGETLEWSLVK